jgi:chaperonin GroES
MTEVKNSSGLSPKGRAVLVKPYEVEEYTAGGIVLPPQVRQRDQLAEQKAVVVAIGAVAWAGEPEPRAKVGDHILFSKWAGYQCVGPADGDTYRVVNDSDIFMTITTPEA